MEVDQNCVEVEQSVEVGSLDSNVNVNQSLSDIFDAAAILMQREGHPIEVTNEGEVEVETVEMSAEPAEVSVDPSPLDSVTYNEEQVETITENEVIMTDNEVVVGSEQVVCQQEEIVNMEDGKDVTSRDELVKVERLDKLDLIHDNQDDEEEEGTLIDSDESDDNSNDDNNPNVSDASAVISDVDVESTSSQHKTLTNSAKETKPAKVSAKVSRKRNKKSQLGNTGASKLFLCPYCDMSAYNLEMIHEHIKLSHPMTGKHKCPDCNYATDHKFGLEIHLVIHNSSSPFHCSKCSFKCNMDFQLNKHINFHTGEKHFKCNQCNYGTDHTTNFRRHMERHSRNAGTACQFCTYSCFNMYQLQKHMQRSHPDRDVNDMRPSKSTTNRKSDDSVKVTEELDSCLSLKDEDGVYRCNQCSFSSKYGANMSRHVSMHAMGSTEQLSCDHCSFTTAFKKNLHRHYKEVHPGVKADETHADAILSTSSHNLSKKKNRYFELPSGASLKRDAEGRMSCIYCDYKTTWHTNLKRHYATHEPKQCPHCNYSSQDKKLFINHLKSHDQTGSDSKTHSENSADGSDYTCTICGFSTIIEKVWRQHQAEHENIQASGDNLETLARTRERRQAAKRADEEFIEGSDIDERLLEENLAPRRPSNRSLTSQRNSHTAAVSSKSTTDKFFCKQCDFTCNHESWLITHMRQHASGKTDHKCECCGYTAPNPHRLKAHMMTHTGYKPYKCPRCDFASSNSSNLYRHIRKKHDPDDVELVKKSKVDDPDSSVTDLADDVEDDVSNAGDEEASPESSDAEEEKTRGDCMAQGRGSMPLVIFRCTECEFTTTSRDSFNEHKEIHAIADIVEGDSSSDDGQTLQGAPHSETTATIVTNNSKPDHQNHSLDITTKINKKVKKKPKPTSGSTGAHALVVNDRRRKLPIWKVKLLEAGTSQTSSASLSGQQATVEYSCTLCQFSYDMRTKLNYHKISTHFGVNPYRCKSCVFRCNSVYYLKRHMRLTHSHVIYGNVIIKRIDSTKSAKISSFNRPAVKYTCDRCGFDTTNKNDWGKHVNEHAQEQLKQLQSMSSASRTKSRSSTTVSAGDNSFNCPECDFSCRRKDMYVAHMKQHSKKSAVSKCDQCPYTTSNPYNLMKHKRTHTGEKPFKCTHCPYRSADSGNLNKHINSHHGGGKARASLARKKAFKPSNNKVLVKPTTPTTCTTPIPTTTISDSTVNNNDDDDDENTVKPSKQIVSSAVTTDTDMQYKCTECDYLCNNEQFLVAHLSIHRKHGDQYVCAICHYASRNQQNLAKHIRTHTGEKPYKCSFCSYSAADKGNLNKHIKTHHKLELSNMAAKAENMDTKSEITTDNNNTDKTASNDLL